MHILDDERLLAFLYGNSQGKVNRIGAVLSKV